MEDKELLIRQTVLLEQIGGKVNAIEAKVNAMNDGEVRELGTQQAVTKEKVSRLENIIYGAITVIFAQAIALIVLWIQKK
jgi:hypothetical protein